MKKMIAQLLEQLGYEVIKTQYRYDKGGIPVDMLRDAAFMEIFHACRPYTMSSPERMYSLFQAVTYVVEQGIEGDFVECGVWKGGSSMIMALRLQQLGDTRRKIYLYDTFEGMSEPTEKDQSHRGEKAESLLNKAQKEADYSVWAYSPIEHVQANLAKTGYAADQLVFVKGKVEDTIPATIPAQIALLRLDTDWYESTKHELIQLYPLLSDKGPLIIDDYGHWEGARQAVDEYFTQQALTPYLHRIDYTGRMMFK